MSPPPSSSSSSLRPSLPPQSTIFFFLVLSLFTTTTFSLTTCQKQNLTIPNTNTSYSECIDLPHLNSFLHFTHHISNSSLSIAFISLPETPAGWVAFGFNPTGTGMAGTQAIAAYHYDGVLTTNTYDIMSYGVLISKNLSTYEVLDLKADQDSRSGMMRIFATLRIPEDVDSLNYVWQVGPEIANDKLVSHKCKVGNLNAKGTMRLSVNGKHSSSDGRDNKYTKSNTILMIWCFISGFIISTLLLGN